jgi:class 3 adenylate cyclase/tetratricopeptide (TPR) repeat protein
MQCSKCGHENRAGAKFCEECAAPLARVCANCGAPLSPTAKFCSECAHPAGASTAPTQPAAPRFDAPQTYTPKYLAEKIISSKAALEGERKHVTVLFADIKGSMELLADRDPEEAKSIIDPVLGHMMDAVHRYEGTVSLVMGDGIMALFGAPLAHEDHAVRACYAALRMQDLVRQYTEQVRRRHGAEVLVRVGLNSGEVVVRSIGSDLHMDYTAVGQTTHLAARMEQLASPGTTRLTAETLKLAEGFVQVKPLGAIPVKGMAEPREVFELVGGSAVRTRLQAARARGLTRFIGRDVEIEQVRSAAQLARGGHGQIVAIVGEAGVGKSRLLHEFIHSHHSHGWLVLESSSVSYGKATPFLPVTDLLRAYLRIEDRDDARGIRAKIIGTLLALDRTLESVVPAIAWLLDALEPGDPFLNLEPAARRKRAVEGTKALLIRESRVQPLMVVFEDLHWIDAETQAVLDGLAESVPTAAVLLAVNYRPEYRHGWSAKTFYRQLRIDPLPPESADKLLETLLGTHDSVTPLKQLLIRRTEGNPLFLEESVRTLVESRALAGEPGAYRLDRDLGSVQIPATVQAILATRIDRLRPELKRVLQAASAIGKDVPFILLEPIAELTGDDLRSALQELQAAEFLYEATLFPNLEYTFKHALTHEVAYGSMLEDRRRALHAQIADTIERLHADRLSELLDVLAHHAVRGKLGAKAVSYLRQAAEKAIARSAHREGIGLLQAALGLLADMPETPDNLSDTLDVLIALGPALIVAHGVNSEEVLGPYDRALALVERLADTSRRFPVIWGLWFVAYGRGDYAKARASAQDLMTAARAGGDSGELVEAHHALWATLSATGEPTAVVSHSEAGIALYDRDRDAPRMFRYAGHDPGTCCRYHLGLNRWLLGYPDQAMVAVRDALHLAEQLDHPMSIMISLWFLAWLHYQRGEEEALEVVQSVRALVDAHGFKGWLEAGILLPDAIKRTRLDETAIEEIGRQLSGSATALWRRLFFMCVFGELCLIAGLPDKGMRALDSIAPAEREAFYGPEIYRIGGELLLMQRQPAAAQAGFQRAIEMARRRSEKSLELRAATSLARLWVSQGKNAQARDLLAPVYGWFTEGFETMDLVAARQLLSKLTQSG